MTGPTVDLTALVLGVVVLAALTYGVRMAGALLRARTTLPDEGERLTVVAVAVMFCALIATSAVLEGGAFAGPARPAGVGVAAVLAWFRAPFLVVVAAAAVVTALLRLAGVP